MEGLMYEVGVSAQFEAAHRLVGDFGPATRMHGHTYRLDVAVRGERLADDNTLYDIGKLREAVDAIAGELHYRDLSDVSGLEGVNTTAEAVASFIWERLAPDLREADMAALTVRVWESPQVYAARDDTLRG
jgi:6-pyruvoyltetrahydropterin/6-carboxytetrahydropterin synthase